MSKIFLPFSVAFLDLDERRGENPTGATTGTVLAGGLVGFTVLAGGLVGFTVLACGLVDFGSTDFLGLITPDWMAALLIGGDAFVISFGFVTWIKNNMWTMVTTVLKLI